MPCPHVLPLLVPCLCLLLAKAKLFFSRIGAPHFQKIIILVGAPIREWCVGPMCPAHQPNTPNQGFQGGLASRQAVREVVDNAAPRDDTNKREVGSSQRTYRVARLQGNVKRRWDVSTLQVHHICHQLTKRSRGRECQQILLAANPNGVGQFSYYQTSVIPQGPKFWGSRE